MIDIRLSENLELMKTMESNSVDLIYCDVLYGTGRKFKDYQDLKPKRDVIEEHYIPRIKEMHRILKDTGSIYLQMDTRINHWLRCILDDVFGYSNFLNEISWKSGVARGARKHSKKFANIRDVILFYSKTKDNTWNALFEPKNYKGLIKKDKNGRLFSLRAIDDYSEKSLANFENDNRIFITKNNKKRLIVYLDEDKGKLASNIWDVIMPCNYQTIEWNDYDTQKPKVLIERIIKASSNEGDTVGDFYGGSFTTAEVCKDLNRNFIGCDISEKGVNIGLKRCGLNCS